MQLLTMPESVRGQTLLLLLALLLNACSSQRPAATSYGEKFEAASVTKDWLKFRVYILPQQQGRRQTENLVLSIMILNMQDNTSPLRKISSSLETYNVYYEYLLNRCKEDITLRYNGMTAYPVYYAFENNYNALPFETINVGYRLEGRIGRHEHPELVFADQIFTHDTLRFPLINIKK